MSAFRHAGLLVRGALCSFSMLGLMTGCTGSSLPHTAPVSGKVTHKGAPVAGATVSFIGTSSERPATAVTGADGSYSLMTLEATGAQPGSYTVLVDKTEMPAVATTSTSMEDALKDSKKPSAEAKSLIPAKYSDSAKSPLKFEVKDGDNKFDIELTE